MQTFSQRAQSLKNRTQTHKKRLIFFPPHATPPLPQCGTASSVSRRSTVAPQKHTAQEPPSRGQSPKARKAQPIDALTVDNRSTTIQQNHTFYPAKPYLLPCKTLPFAKRGATPRAARDAPPHHAAPHSRHKKAVPQMRDGTKHSEISCPQAAQAPILPAIKTLLPPRKMPRKVTSSAFSQY